MGSFNASCAVSKCSINPGDRVKLIPIVSTTSLNTEYSSQMHLCFGCYCYDYFKFLGLPMDATYEDYGNFDVLPGFASDYNLSIIKQNYTQTPLPTDVEERRYLDREPYETTADDLDWETIGKMIHYGTIFLDSNQDFSRRKHLGFFPILECVYNVMMERTHEMYFDNHYSRVTLDQYYESQVQELSGFSKELEAKISEYMELFGDSIGEIGKSGKVITAEEIYEKAVRMAEFSIGSHTNRDEYSYKNTSSMTTIRESYQDLYSKPLTDNEELTIIRLKVELLFVVCALNAFQIPILPPMTAGQQYDKTEHASFLIRIGQEIMNMQNKDNDESEFNEWEFNTTVSAVVQVSLQKLRSRADNDYQNERGKKALELIDDFVLEYPNGMEMNTSELMNSKYALFTEYFESNLLNFKFIVDLTDEDGV